MNPENEWDLVRGWRGSRFESAGMGALRITLLFGSAAVALALIAAPILANQTDNRFAGNGSHGIDMMSTGTIGYKGSYTIRKSVLQGSPNSVCIIRDNGTRSGDC